MLSPLFSLFGLVHAHAVHREPGTLPLPLQAMSHVSSCPAQQVARSLSSSTTVAGSSGTAKPAVCSCPCSSSHLYRCCLGIALHIRPHCPCPCRPAAASPWGIPGKSTASRLTLSEFKLALKQTASASCAIAAEDH